MLGCWPLGRAAVPSVTVLPVASPAAASSPKRPRNCGVMASAAPPATTAAVPPRATIALRRPTLRPDSSSSSMVGSPVPAGRAGAGRPRPSGRPTAGRAAQVRAARRARTRRRTAHAGRPARRSRPGGVGRVVAVGRGRVGVAVAVSVGVLMSVPTAVVPRSTWWHILVGHVPIPISEKRRKLLPGRCGRCGDCCLRGCYGKVTKAPGPFKVAGTHSSGHLRQRSVRQRPGAVGWTCRQTFPAGRTRGSRARIGPTPPYATLSAPFTTKGKLKVQVSRT